MSKKKPTVLMILDGYGLNDKVEGNAVKQANTPVMDDLMANCPFVEGQASGMAVGLPEGQMGNSEVGHLNMPSRACRGPGLCRRGRPGYRQGSPVVRGAGPDEAPPERQICPGQQHPGLSGAERLPQAGWIKPLSLASPGSSPDRRARNAGVFRQMTSKRSRCPDFPIRRGGAA